MPTSILIVDDNPDDREMIRRALADVPGIVLPIPEAVDEASCLKRIRGDRPIDCVLLDYSLPGRDGLKVLRSILDLDASVAVVMITGQGDEHIAVQAIKRGAQDYLSKDMMSRDLLRRAIANATERARMQEKIRKQQESLQSFAHVLVHDLRAPLRTVQRAITMLSEDLPADVLSENTEMLDFAAQGARRMDQLIMALKAYTEIDGAKPVFEAVNLNVEVEAVQSGLTTDLEAANATVVCEGVLPTIHGDSPLIAQLLQNIIGNGVKYNRSEAPQVCISSSDNDGAWQIEITDNGIGIDGEDLEKIFSPFKRLHGVGVFEGSGLGLATCKKIADLHGGKLWCRSEPGQGTTFILEVPRK